MKTRIFFAGLLFAVFCTASLSYADVPQMINYQGRLADTTGNAIDTTVSMTFAIYTDSVGTDSLWSETQNSVIVEGGMFNLLLGSVTLIPDSVFDGSTRYLGVKVGTDEEMSPRRPLVSAGYAFRSEFADTAEYARVGASDDDWVIQGDTIYHEQGNVGIGTTSPANKLDVAGNIHASGTIRSGNSITIDGVNDKITASGGKIDFDDEDLVTTGDVGIGTTSPGEEIEVYKNQNDWTNLRLNNPNGGNNAGSAIYFHEGGGYRAYIAAANSGNTVALAGPRSLSIQSNGGPIHIRTVGDHPVSILPYGGNVGIGTTTPGEELDVVGDLQTSGNVKVGGNIVELNPGFVAGNLRYQSNQLSFFGGNSGISLRDAGGNTKVVMLNSGDVGIGITAPSDKLHVNNGNVRISGAGNGIYFSDGSFQTTAGVGSANSVSNNLDAVITGDADANGSGGVKLRTDSNDRITVLNNGNVGIGITNPTEKLDVAGTVKMTGFKLPGGAANGYVLTSDASGVGTWQVSTGGGGLASVDGVSNPGGDVDLIAQNAINITPNDGANTITIGESHSARTDNPHQVTATQTGAIVSTDGVSNPGGDVDLVPQNAITITPNDGANTITVGESHSARTDNPHQVTATQTGALLSVDGVSNPGGDVDFVAGTNMTITPDPTGDSITFSATVNYAQVFTVAQTGGNFTTIGAALNSCVNPGCNNSYLIRVMPGVYNETVVCSSFVRLQGAGKYVSYITGTVTAVDSVTIDGFNIAGGILCPGTCPTITHNIITNGVGDGILITNLGQPWIKENEIIDCAGWGIHCNGWDTNAWIIANKIERNGAGGIRCTDSSPTISNNQILANHNYGIYLIGAMGQPSEPTIDDNVIGRTQPTGSGIGIYMIGYAEPRIIANDIWINYTGIEIHPSTQPSILANNISYNNAYGIICFSSGASRPVTIKSNHIHSNPTVGLDIVNAAPIVTHNNINVNDPSGVNPDIQYVGPPFPMISMNVVDIIAVAGTGATGLYNVTGAGAAIAP